MIKVVSLTILLAALVATAEDQKTLLQTEYDYISELLTMNLPVTAQKHLDIVKNEFPAEKNEIHYYQAHISFRLAKYPEAIVHLERLAKLTKSRSRLTEARKLLTLAYLRIGQFEESLKNFKTIEPFGGKNSWYASTCVELAETQSAAFAKKSAATRCELKKEAYDLFKRYIQAFPDNEKMPWIRFFVAEYEYDKLVSLLYKLGKLKDEASPDVVKEKKKTIIIQLHKARKIYQSINDSSPTHPVIKRVEPRLRYLVMVVDKLKRDESFLPKDEVN